MERAGTPARCVAMRWAGKLPGDASCAARDNSTSTSRTRRATPVVPSCCPKSRTARARPIDARNVGGGLQGSRDAGCGMRDALPDAVTAARCGCAFGAEASDLLADVNTYLNSRGVKTREAHHALRRFGAIWADGGRTSPHGMDDGSVLSPLRACVPASWLSKPLHVPLSPVPVSMPAENRRPRKPHHHHRHRPRDKLLRRPKKPSLPSPVHAAAQTQKLAQLPRKLVAQKTFCITIGAIPPLSSSLASLPIPSPHHSRHRHPIPHPPSTLWRQALLPRKLPNVPSPSHPAILPSPPGSGWWSPRTLASPVRAAGSLEYTATPSRRIPRDPTDRGGDGQWVDGRMP